MDKYGDTDRALSYDALEEILEAGAASIVCPRWNTKRLERVSVG